MVLSRLYFFITLFFLGNIHAQNLVLNPSMEEPAECPVSSKFGFFFDGPCKYWTCPKTGTPDYYHATCAFPGSATTTNNSAPHSGNAFVGFYNYGKFGNAQNWLYNREYVQGILSSPLLQGKVYAVSFWVKPMNADKAGISAAIQEIGIHFSDSIVKTSSDFRIIVIPQVENQNGPVNNLNQWTLVKGCFTANGGEKYFTIGNFRTDENTVMVPLAGASNTQLGYCLLDDVEVVSVGDANLITSESAIICESDSIAIKINKGLYSNFVWDNGNTDTARWLSIAGKYLLTASYKDICTIKDSFELQTQNCNICNFYIPTAFTPDNNFLNEKFKLQSDCKAQVIRLQIYSRWGEKIYDNTSKMPAWDGKFNGELLPEGIFIYSFDILYEQGGQILRQTRNGAVTLLR